MLASMGSASVKAASFCNIDIWLYACAGEEMQQSHWSGAVVSRQQLGLHVRLRVWYCLLECMVSSGVMMRFVFAAMHARCHLIPSGSTRFPVATVAAHTREGSHVCEDCQLRCRS